MTMWTPEEGELYEALNKILANIVEAEERLQDAAEYDNGEYLRRCAEKLQSARQEIWPERQRLIRVEAYRRQARGPEMGDGPYPLGPDGKEMVIPDAEE